MLIIEVNEKQPIEKALKKYKRKFDKIKILRELRNRKEFTKKSVNKREKLKKAIYLQKKFGNNE
jgi:small subunit ribosomal protein S21